MDVVDDRTIALVALLRAGGRAWANYVLAARRAGGHQGVDPLLVLEQQLGLLSYEAHAAAADEVRGWLGQGYRLLTIGDEGYPANLRVVEARPPLLFVAGELSTPDGRSVSVIGTRRPSGPGRALARELAETLVRAGFTVVSGLAAGVDTEVHLATLAAGGRTLAVIGTGLGKAYPPENRPLQERIAREGAVVSQFWPNATASRQSFPARNAVMSGITLASVIVEAGPHSGTRTQARHALAQGRAVILMEPVLEHSWARELTQHSGVLVAESAGAAVRALSRRTA